MPDSATAFSRKISEVINPAVQRRAQAQPTAVASIEANPVYQIMMSAETTPEQKRDAVAAFLTCAETKQENRARVEAYQEFEEFMQAERERMAKAIIQLTDTTTFSELQAVYRDLNNALTDFDEKMKPLTDIVDALYVLRTNDKTVDAFREIKDDRQRQAEIEKQKTEKAEQFSALRTTVDRVTGDIAVLAERKAFFGWGNTTQAARQEIARKEIELQGAQDRIAGIQHELADLEQRGPGSSSLGEFAAQKDKLRELLDISSDEHKKRQDDLVASALNFVTTAKERIGAVRQHLGQMSGQIDNLYDANARMSGVYAVLTDGIKNAGEANQQIRATLAPPTGDEPLIAKMAREDKNLAVEEHIAALGAAGGHTTEAYADLTSQTIRIKTMRDSTQSQIDKARDMGTQGVAGVADRLSVVLQAVSSAALGESSAMARDTLSRMVDSTNKIAQKETVRVAMGIDEANADVLKAIDDLGAYGEVVRTSTDITRKGLTEMRGNLAKIKELAESVRGDVHEAIATSADVQAGDVQPSIAPPRSAFGV